MILIGQFDSSFVRRVGIAMRLYGLAFEHRPWSTFGEADKIRAYSPLLKVPVLVLDDGEALVDSHYILDYLDGLVPAERALLPRVEPDRHRALKVVALATGIGDALVSLFYEKALHPAPSTMLIARREGQIRAALGILQADRAGRSGPYWFGGTISHADIAVGAVLRHLNDSLPDLADMRQFPALVAHCARLEALPVFQDISQAFVPPA